MNVLPRQRFRYSHGVLLKCEGCEREGGGAILERSE